MASIFTEFRLLSKLRIFSVFGYVIAHEACPQVHHCKELIIEHVRLPIIVIENSWVTVKTIQLSYNIVFFEVPGYYGKITPSLQKLNQDNIGVII